jgi:amidase
LVTGSGISRRAFVGAGLAGGAALASGGWRTLPGTATTLGGMAPPSDALWLEKSIPQLQSLLASGALTSRELTQGYLQRIAALNPLLGAVIETNPNAVAIAAKLDAERRAGHVRGPLHGIPLLLKDNVATDDGMQTTAGSLALYGSQVPGDAPIAARLRAAGAILLGKANLSEWANFRGFAPFNGWSARGGFARDPYLLSFDPSGSSTGSAVGTAANLCAAAVGTETDGSIVSPSGNNLIFGLKPTIGLLAQDGIVPIAHSQDTAGPMARTATDVAILLGAMQSPFGAVAEHGVPADYTPFLRRGALAGRRIGVDARYFTPDYGGEPDIVAVAQHGLSVMQSLGATLVETDSGDPFAWFDAEFTVLLFEFKVQIAQYLATLGHTSMRTLADLMAFNVAHCPAEMRYFGQEIFELAESTSGDLTDPDYLAARAACIQLARVEGIDAALQRDHLDAIVAPSWSYASSVAAVAGYPNLSIPLGITTVGRPAGLWMYGGFLAEPSLLAFAYDLEQAVDPRSQPAFAGVPPTWDDAGICASLPTKPHVFSGLAHMPHHIGTGKPFRR